MTGNCRHSSSSAVRLNKGYYSCSEARLALVNNCCHRAPHCLRWRYALEGYVLANPRRMGCYRQQGNPGLLQFLLRFLFP